MNDDDPARETLVKELPPFSMNEPPKSKWLKPLLGGIVGAVVGGVLSVFIVGFLLRVVYPMFVDIDWERPSGLVFWPLLLVALGIISGALIGARWQAPWKLFEKLCKWLFRTV